MVKIVLDAGHGSNTPGKRCPDDSMREFEFNNAVVKQAKKLLTAYSDVDVLFTHDVTGKVDVPLETRVTKAVNWGGDCLISVHANAFGSDWNEAHGFESFVYDSGSKSLVLQSALHTRLLEATNIKDRGKQTAQFYVLSGKNLPSVLVECGFMTNKVEASFLKSNNYRNKCASAIVEALVAVYKLKKKAKSATKPSGGEKVYRVVTGSFATKESANAQVDKLKAKGFESFIDVYTK